MSVLLATSTVPLRRFTYATACSLLKIILHIYIGSTVRDLSETTNLTPARLAITLFGTAVAVIVMVVLTVEVRRVLARAEAAAAAGSGLGGSDVVGDGAGDSEEVLLDKSDDWWGKHSDNDDDYDDDSSDVDYVELEDGAGRA
ncbi:hypothetical protein HDU86_001826 [Geranomyces michiganensis]|nr:hypothetical protein HDU86_001826 [Geranomyces michiganensis]